MHYREIYKVLGVYFLLFSVVLLVPLIFAAYYEYVATPEAHPFPHSTSAFFYTFLISFFIGIICTNAGRTQIGTIFRKESVAIVVLIWVLTPIVACLPFYLTNTLENPFQAYFEATSGLTTTGASVIQPKAYDANGKEIPIEKTWKDVRETTYSFYGNVAPIVDPVTHEVLYEGVEALGKALLFWRSFLQFFGGGGIIVLYVAIFPSLGISGKMLFQAEITGPIKGSNLPRVTQTAFQLWAVYVGLNIIQTVVLLWTNSKMELFDAITIAFATISTGGFSIRNASIGYYENAFTDWVVIIFMILGATNFTIYYHALRGKFFRIYQPELWAYLAIIFVTCGISTWYLAGTEKVLLTNEAPGIFSYGEALKYATFQVVSSLTTTGFSSANYDIWPYPIQAIMLLVMFIGGMSGSTAAGIKVVRLYILFQIARSKVENLVRPQTVRQLKLGQQEINSDTMLSVLNFFWVAVSLSALGALCFIFDGVDPGTAIGLVADFVNGVGIGFRMAGPPAESCAFLSNFSLVVSSLLMLLGRLEYLVLLAVLVPAFWRET